MRCKLKEVMDSRGIQSQLELSKAVGVSPGTIGRMYRDQLSRLDFETVDKITEFFNITDISELFELAPNDE